MLMQGRLGLALGTAALHVGGSLVLTWLGIRTVQHFIGLIEGCRRKGRSIESTAMPLVFLVALPFVASVLAALLPSNARNRESTLAGLVALGCAVQVALVLSAACRRRRDPRARSSGCPRSASTSSFRIDGFAWMFAMLVLGIGALVVLYARYYMSPADPVPRFFSFFLAFMGAMLGVVLSGNLIQLVLFWELTSLFSFLLIGYWHHRRDARRGARMALTVTGAGGLCLLAGVLVLGHIVGSYDLDAVLAVGRR